jgi:hypothetical protein
MGSRLRVDAYPVPNMLARLTTYGGCRMTRGSRHTDSVVGGRSLQLLQLLRIHDGGVNVGGRGGGGSG